MNPIIEDRAIVRGGLKEGDWISSKELKQKAMVAALVGDVVCILGQYDHPEWRTYEYLIWHKFELDITEPPKPEPKMEKLSKEQAQTIKTLWNMITPGVGNPMHKSYTESFHQQIDAITDKSGDVGKE